MFPRNPHTVQNLTQIDDDFSDMSQGNTGMYISSGSLSPLPKALGIVPLTNPLPTTLLWGGTQKGSKKTLMQRVPSIKGSYTRVTGWYNSAGYLQPVDPNDGVLTGVTASVVMATRPPLSGESVTPDFQSSIFAPYVSQRYDNPYPTHRGGIMRVRCTVG